MLQLVPQMKIFVACETVDFRKGIDGLAGVCRSKLGKDPFSGALFLFRNRSRTSLKILVYDGQGFWLCTKRLSSGRLKWWPKSAGAPLTSLAARELQVLLWNGNPNKVDCQEDWRKIGSGGRLPSQP
jgi:hypothetical protein